MYSLILNQTEIGADTGILEGGEGGVPFVTAPRDRGVIHSFCHGAVFTVFIAKLAQFCVLFSLFFLTLYFNIWLKCYIECFDFERNLYVLTSSVSKCPIFP